MIRTVDPESFLLVSFVAATIDTEGDWRDFCNSIQSIGDQVLKVGMLGISIHFKPGLYENPVDLLSKTVFSVTERLALGGWVQVLNQKRSKTVMHQYQELLTRLPAWIKKYHIQPEQTWVMFGTQRGIWHPYRAHAYATVIGTTRPGMEHADLPVSSVCAMEFTTDPEEGDIGMSPQDVEDGIQKGRITSVVWPREMAHKCMSMIHDLAVPLRIMQEYFIDPTPERQWLIQNNRLCDSHFSHWVRSYGAGAFKTLFPQLEHWLICCTKPGVDELLDMPEDPTRRTIVQVMPLPSAQMRRAHASLLAEMWEFTMWREIAANLRQAQVHLLGGSRTSRAKTYTKICADTIIDRAKQRNAFIAGTTGA